MSDRREKEGRKKRTIFSFFFFLQLVSVSLSLAVPERVDLHQSSRHTFFQVLARSFYIERIEKRAELQ